MDFNLAPLIQKLAHGEEKIRSKAFNELKHYIKKKHDKNIGKW